ncbi:NUDIX hydrolase [Lacticaseibacillus jixiensis]|uniref:NUDIX hydrolase n=1 Tax=Lacticaseibacillus jixiensis TaxID=3231926 RepID=UPI0036F374BC
MERLIKTENLYEGKILTLQRQTVALADDTSALREVVHTSGSSGVLAIDGAKALFVRQWRTPLGQETLEVPAVRIEAQESPLMCAKRELNEEAGLSAANWHEAADFYQAAGFSDARCHLFMATDLTTLTHKRPQDVGEFVRAQWLTLEEAQAQVDKRLIVDAKSQLAVVLWANAQLKGQQNARH